MSCCRHAGLDEEWPIEDMFEGERMRYPRYRKLALTLLANPLTLIPQGIFLWQWLPSLSEGTRYVGTTRTRTSRWSHVRARLARNH